MDTPCPSSAPIAEPRTGTKPLRGLRLLPMGHRGVEPRTSRLSAPSHWTTDSDIGRHRCRSMSETARAPVADVVRCRNRDKADVGMNGHTNRHTRTDGPSRQSTARQRGARRLIRRVWLHGNGAGPSPFTVREDRLFGRFPDNLLGRYDRVYPWLGRPVEFVAKSRSYGVASTSHHLGEFPYQDVGSRLRGRFVRSSGKPLREVNLADGPLVLTPERLFHARQGHQGAVCHNSCRTLRNIDGTSSLRRRNRLASEKQHQ